MISCETLASMQLRLSAPAILTTVLISSKEERVGHLTTEPPGHVDEALESNDGGVREGEMRTANQPHIVLLDDLGATVENEAKRPSNRNERQGLEGSVER